MPIGGVISNFPQGFANGINVRGVPLLQAQPGNVFWLNNTPNVQAYAAGGSDNNRGTYQRPFATLSVALAACLPGNNDIIMVGPNHQENISSATATVMSASGVAVIGMGSGQGRPTFTFDTAATSTLKVAGESMSVQNCLFIGNFLSVASAFTAVSSSFTGVIASGVLTVSSLTGSVYVGSVIRGAGVTPGTVIISQLSGTTNGVGTYKLSGTQTLASVSMTTQSTDFAIDNCEFHDTSSVLGFLSIYTTSSTAQHSDRFSLTRSVWNSLGTVSPTVAISCGAAQDGWNISDNFMVSPTTAVTEGPILLATGSASLTAFNCARNTTQRPGVSTTVPCGISTSGTAWTGHCYDNKMGTGLSGATGIWISTGTKLAFTNNFSMITRAADKSAIINPVAV